MKGKRALVVAIVALTSMLDGCSGTLVSRKFDDTALKPGDQLAGVPFSMNRPKLLITKTVGADGKPDTYAVTPGWEPDPNARYVLNIKPGWFSSVDWTMTFDEFGTLTDTNAKTTDQSASFIQAIGVIAATTLAWTSVDLKPPARAVDQCKNRRCPSATTINRDIGALEIGIKRRIWNVERSEWTTLSAADSALMLCASNDFWDKRVARAESIGQLSSFTYGDLSELSFILTSLHSHESISNPALADVDRFVAENSGNVQQVAYRFRSALADYDWAAFQIAKNALVKARESIYAEGEVNLAVDVKSKLSANSELLKLASGWEARGFHEAFIQAYKLANIKFADWRAARLKDLDQKIARLEFIAATPPTVANKPFVTSTALAVSLMEERQLRAQILGVYPEFKRRMTLFNQLVTGSIEPKTALLEIDYLDKRILGAETAVALVKTPSKSEDPVPARYLVSHCKLSDEEVTKKVDANETLGSRRAIGPPYVVVFNPADAADCTPPTAGARQ